MDIPAKHAVRGGWIFFGFSDPEVEASSCGGSVAVRQIFCGPRSVGPPLPGRGVAGEITTQTGLR